jgi:hypothetical protein
MRTINDTLLFRFKIGDRFVVVFVACRFVSLLEKSEVIVTQKERLIKTSCRHKQ